MQTKDMKPPEHSAVTLTLQLNSHWVFFCSRVSSMPSWYKQARQTAYMF